MSKMFEYRELVSKMTDEEICKEWSTLVENIDTDQEDDDYESKIYWLEHIITIRFVKKIASEKIK